MPQFGPGTFEVGNADTKFNASCLVNSLSITPAKDQGDSTTKLCGTVRPGAVTYTYTLAGNVDIDSNDAQGLFALSQAAKGSQLPFAFTPSDGGTEASGVFIIDPLGFGGDEYGADMTDDFEWSMVGEPEYVFPGDAAGRTAGNWWERLVLSVDDLKPLTPVGPAHAPVDDTPAADTPAADTPAADTPAAKSSSKSAKEPVPA